MAVNAPDANLTMPETATKSARPLQLYSIVIPAQNEDESLPSTLEDIYGTFTAESVSHAIIVIDDRISNRDRAGQQELRTKVPRLLPIVSPRIVLDPAKAMRLRERRPSMPPAALLGEIVANAPAHPNWLELSTPL